MATGTNHLNNEKKWHRGLRLVAIALILGGFVAAAYIASDLTRKIVDLREVPRDNIQWNTAQLEVDYLKMRTALTAASENPEALGQFRKRYDIFYSRVKVIEGATRTLPINDNDGLRRDRQALDHFLRISEPLVDSPDAVLLAELPQIEQRLEVIRDAPRDFALGTVQVMARISDTQRLEIIDVLRELAIASFVVVGALLMSLGAVTVQRVELTRRASEITRAGRMRESTLRAALDAIVVIDEEGRISDYNSSAEKLFGYHRDEIIGQSLAQTIVPPAFRDAHIAGFKNYASAEKSGIVDQGRMELVALHKDGHEFPIEISISEVTGETGPNFVSYIRDITDEKLAKAELQQARDKALTAFREKSHFFAVMSHEMRTPLNGIMSALNLMRDEPMSERQERFVGIAESSSQVLLSHIDDVLLIERLDSGEVSSTPVPFRPAELIEELADRMRPLANQQNTVLVTEYSGPGVAVLGQSRAFQQVLMNLVSNAIKFTPSGKVTIRTRAKPTGASSIKLDIAVIDTGVGISTQDQARIFDDFVTVDSPYERTASGTGLGLGIVRRLVSQMGGEVTCESVPDRGTTFRITLTLDLASDESLAELPPPDTLDTGANVIRSMNVLIVEDNPINAEVLEAMLVREGQKVSLARDGFEGVHVASRAHFDLILMDVSMPNMNGIKATQEIRASRGLSKTSPIYAVTAHAMPQEVEEFMAAGMAGCVLKPIKPAALLKVLRDTAHAKDASEERDAASDSAAAPVAQDTMLDHETMDDLSDLLGAEKFGQKLAAFIEESAKAMTDIEAARSAGDIEGLQRHAHKLAGSCGVFGASELHADLQTIEALCKSGEEKAALEEAASVGKTWEATRTALNAVAGRA
ncbi:MULTISPECIES: ATP-binding protein [unclassified Marinovum]